jgi:hypothetical protein
MVMALPPGIPTLKALASGNETRVDQVFCDEDAKGLIDLCDTRPEWRPVKTNHYPVICRIWIGVEGNKFKLRHNFRDVNWPEFARELILKLSELPIPEKITERQEVAIRLQAVDDVIHQTIAEHVPLTKPCPYSKHWWNKDLSTHRKEVKKLARDAWRVRGIEGHPDHERYRKARNTFTESIRTTKAAHWAKWLAELNDRTVWTANKMVMGPANDGGASCVPTLQIKDPITKITLRENKDNTAKAQTFYSQFFPQRPEEDMTPPNAEYPPAKWTYKPVTDEQIDRAIRKMKPYKGTRPETIPNCVFIKMRKLLILHLGPIYRATDTLKEYPEDWKLTHTPVIRKPGKADYTLPGAWRPIVLSNGHARVLNSAKTDDIVNNCEWLGVLPALHFGGRPG